MRLFRFSHAPITVAMAGYALAVLSGILALFVSDALTTGFSGADESAHFLNGYFVSTYLRDYLGVDPLAFATDYYIHYPKLSIGHWPPAYYAFLGALFLLLPPTPEVIFIVNVVISSLPAIGVVLAIHALAGPIAALAGAAIYSATPLVVEGYALFMVDQALAACTLAAAFGWYAFSRHRSWSNALRFSLLAATSVMLKGNGWLMALVPIFHILLTAEWNLLKSFKLYATGLAAIGLVVPWYAVTSRIAADGFNYQMGLPYAGKALVANIGTLVANLGPAGIGLAVVALLMAYLRRNKDKEIWSLSATFLSLILSTLALQSIIPVDIDPRYLAPALPALTILAVMGVFTIYSAIKQRSHSLLAAAIAVALAASMAAPGLMHLLARAPKADFRVADVAALLSDRSELHASVIDGPSGAEGAFIAEMAKRDPALQHYVVRASKLLSESNFMGTKYELKFNHEEEVLDELQRLGIKYVVVVRPNGVHAFPHGAVLYRALQLPASPYRRTQVLLHRNRTGITEVFEANSEVAPSIKAIREAGLPSKAAAIVNK